MSDLLPLEITPAEVKKKLDAHEALFLIDVRTPEEHQIARIEGAALIPMDQIPAALGELESNSEDGTLIVFCHHGVRSANVANWLRGQGISTVQSMAGGIDRWSIEIDPTVPKY